MNKISRKGFIKIAAAAAMSGVTAGALAACNAASGSASASGAAGQYIPGTYEGTAEGISSTVKVTMTFSDSAVTDVVVDTSGETASFGAAAADELREQLMAAGSAEIDGVSGSTITSDAVMKAAKSCYAQAKGEAVVSSVQLPTGDENDWLGKARRFTSGLSAETGINADEYYRMIVKGRNERKRYMKLLTNLDRGTLLKLESLPLMEEGRYKSGIIVEKHDSRKYPYGTLARRTIGYVKDNSSQKEDEKGRSHIGIEGKYDYVLHGKEGEIWLKPTDNKEKIQNYDSTYVKPVDGLDVRTTLDITLQDIVDKAMRKQMSANPKIEDGCAVFMDVRTGAIRAMVNLTKSPKDSSLNEVYNMAIGYGANPGSVFKTTTLMTALEDGYIKSLDDEIPTNGGKLPGYPQDDHVKNLVKISILHGFEISSNYVFRYLAVKNYNDNPKRFLDKLYMYKLGQAFDFDLKGLSEPYIPSPDSKQWSATDLGSTAIGYSVKETPLHILTFYNAIANKGRMMKPYLVESIEKNGAVKTKKGPSVLNASI
mgnify:CR=1 FL=1